ncbi:MAG: efflux RND transporter periplasmic adaptor subunit [Phycisphaeraceae bacterium]|nr:efflux RND transporter periplasmic adaptor subunit [Phycisphaeraceae bacterium]
MLDRTPPTHQHQAPRASIVAVLISLSLLGSLASCKDSTPSAGATTPRTAHESRDHGHGDHDEHADEVVLTSEAIDRYGIAVGEAQLWILRSTFVAPARIAFNTEAMAHVGSLVRGRAVEISARLGDQVKKGDPLVIVESPELGQAQADLLLKRAAVETALPQVELARAAWDRARGLLEHSQGISLTEVQRREAEYKATVAGVKAAEATAVAAENELHLLGMDQSAIDELVASGEVRPRYTVRAAIDGRVVQREITLGELVSPDRESLMVLADTSMLWVLADVPESRLPSIAVGGKAWVSAGHAAAGPGEGAAARFEGQISYVSPLVDPTTRTAQVRIEIPSEALGAAAIRPGMFAQVEIVAAPPDGNEPPPRVAVPQGAVQQVEGGPAVFVPVPGEPNTFQKRALTVGPTVGGLVPVFAGLVEGEKFAESGSFILKAELGKGSAAHEH